MTSFSYRLTECTFDLISYSHKAEKSPCTASEKRYEFFLSLPLLLGLRLKSQCCQFLSFLLQFCQSVHIFLLILCIQSLKYPLDNSVLPTALTLDSPNTCSTGFSIRELMNPTQVKIWSFGIKKGSLTRCTAMEKQGTSASSYYLIIKQKRPLSFSNRFWASVCCKAAPHVHTPSLYTPWLDDLHFPC